MLARKPSRVQPLYYNYNHLTSSSRQLSRIEFRRPLLSRSQSQRAYHSICYSSSSSGFLLLPLFHSSLPSFRFYSAFLWVAIHFNCFQKFTYIGGVETKSVIQISSSFQRKENSALHTMLNILWNCILAYCIFNIWWFLKTLYLIFLNWNLHMFSYFLFYVHASNFL